MRHSDTQTGHQPGHWLSGPGFCGGFAALGTLVACALVVGLWLMAVEGTLRRALTGHAALVLRQVQNAAEAGLGLGLNLEELWRLTDLLDRLHAGDSDLGALAILDESGVAIFATSRAEVGANPLLGLELRALEPGKPLRMGTEPAGTIYTLPLSTAFGTAGGQVLLRIPDAVVRARVTAFALDLVPQAALVAGGGALAAVLLAGWMRRRQDRRLRPLTRALWALRDGQAGESASEAAEADPFLMRQQERLRVLAVATRDVTRLDEMA